MNGTQNIGACSGEMRSPTPQKRNWRKLAFGRLSCQWPPAGQSVHIVIYLCSIDHKIDFKIPHAYKHSEMSLVGLEMGNERMCVFLLPFSSTRCALYALKPKAMDVRKLVKC